MEEEDPFGVFSDDDDDGSEENEVEDNEAARIAKSLIAQANTKMNAQTETPKTDTAAAEEELLDFLKE